MRTVRVNTKPGYDIHIGGGLLAQTGSLLSPVVAPCKAVLVSDTNVSALYGKTVEDALRTAGYEVHTLILAPGEETKSMQTLCDVLQFLCEWTLSRSDVIIALGGGVIGDVAGFAASVYLRGIPYVQIPTTFLAAVDSSVGGKTAVNLPAGKNLAGSFYQPHLVVCDTDALLTLPVEVYADGVSEAVKYGMIGSATLFDSLSRGVGLCDVEDVIAQCVVMKAAFVEDDEYDVGLRQMLNFGHTLGHAIEAQSDYTIPHGHAVAIGMVVFSRAAYKSGLCGEDIAPALIAALERNGLPVSCAFNASALAEAATADKKRRGGNITLVLPERIGRCFLHKLPMADLEGFIAGGLSDG
jgi:3-dehydroquinate synthase